MRNWRWFLVLVLTTCLPAKVFAQVKVEGTWRLRIEDWQWFDVPGFDTDYTYAHSLLRLALRGETGQPAGRRNWRRQDCSTCPMPWRRPPRVNWALGVR